MWTRAELKYSAKAILRVSYWRIFGVCLLAMLLGGLIFGGAVNVNLENIRTITGNGTITRPTEGWYNSFWVTYDTYLRMVANNLLFFISIISGITLVFTTLVSGPVSVGLARYLLNAGVNRASFKDLWYGFGQGRYGNAVVVMLWRNILIFLWTLLFIIPGLIKTYAYSMVPYILADSPDMPPSEAIRRSQDMTRGHKWEMFVLNLSFIGWYLLSSILCGAGAIFVSPYVEMTFAELYVKLSGRPDQPGYTEAQTVEKIQPTAADKSSQVGWE